MDPVSVIGLIGALCNIIEASNHLYKIAKSLKDSNGDLAQLCNDVAFFGEALKGFDRVLRSQNTKHHISQEIITKALEESSLTIENLDSLLSTIAGAESTTARSLKWLQNKSKIKKLHERIKAQSGMLQSFLALANTETFLNACTQYPQLLAVSSSANPDDPESRRLSVATTAVSETASLASKASKASLSTKASSIEELEQTDAKGSRGSLELTRSRSNTDSNGNILFRKGCRFDCFCSCHPTTEVDRANCGGQVILEKAFAKINLSSGVCDDPECERPHSSDKSQRSDVSTSRFFQKALSHIASSHTVKVRYHLNVFHTVAESSDVMRYCKQGNLEKLQAAIQSGQATLWDTAPDGWSLLHTAAYNRQLPTVKYLLDMGSDTEVADIGTRKPADLAILNSLLIGATDVEVAINKAFAEKDDYISAFEFTPIHIAVLDLYDVNDRERPSLESVLHLIDECNNAPAKTDWSKWRSKYRKRSPVFQNVVEFFRASAYELPKHTKIIHNLIDKKDRSLQWTPLHWACSTGKVAHIKTLMYHGADPFILSNLDFNILHAAAESKAHGGLDAAIEIWTKHPDRLNINQPNHWGETPLHIAAWGSVDNVRKLLNAGADRSFRQEDGQVPLHCTGMTARGQDRKMLINLLCNQNTGDHINAQDCDGRPPLFEFLDDAECVKMLASHGAKLDLLDDDGQSIFHHTCNHGSARTLLTLLRLLGPESVLVTVKDHQGDTALNLALKYRNRKCAMLLLSELQDVGDVVGQDGWAAVHHAAKLGDEKILELVLTHASFVKGMKTIDGKTAEVVAMEAGHWQGGIKNLLRQYNAIT